MGPRFARRVPVVVLATAVLVGLALGIPLGVAPRPAWAHSSLLRMEPADGATVAAAPIAVRLVFDEAVQSRFDVVAVTAPDGNRVDTGEPQAAGTVVTQPLVPLSSPGRYTVAYRLVSADGHPVTKQLSFSYQPAPPSVSAAPSPPAPSAAATPATVIGTAAPGAVDGSTGGVGTGSDASPVASGGTASAGFDSTWLYAAAVAVVGVLAAVGFRRRQRRGRPTGRSSGGPA